MLLMIRQNDTMAVQLTEEELRALVRDEVMAALDSRSGSTARQEPGSGTRTQSPYLSVRQASEYSRMAISTIRQGIRSGQLKAHKCGRRVLIKIEDLQNYIER